MADTSGTRKGRTPSQVDDPKATPRASRPDSTDVPGEPGTAPGELTPKPEPQTLDEARARISELEEELSAAKATIAALLSKAERRLAVSVQASDADTGPTPPAPSSNAGHRDPRFGSIKLDQLVRQRTRALAESEAQLRRKNSELARLNEMKAEFISIATHEMRTPLTSIVGYLDMFADGRFGELPESMARPISSLRRNAHRLKHLVDEMLDVNRIDSGRITLYRTVCSFGKLIEKVVNDFRPTAAARDITVELSVDADFTIDADTSKLDQAACKLLASAMRHTPGGGTITVIVDQEPERQFAGMWARLRIRGAGVDIPREMSGRLFEPFSDIHTAKHHTSSGPDSAGLGLYIARGLIDLHGGLIKVESREGEIIEFTVILPALDDNKPG